MIKTGLRGKFPLLIVLAGIIITIKSNYEAMLIGQITRMNAICLKSAINMISEIQRERGRAAIFLRDRSTLSDLEKQRLRSDEASALFVPALSASGIDGGVKSSSADATVKLEDVRKKIGESISEPAEAIKLYSEIIDDLMLVVKATANAADSIDIGRAMSSITILAAVGENAGILRATLSEIIKADKPVSFRLINTVVSLRSAMTTGLKSKAIVVSPSGNAALNEFSSRPHWQSLEQTIERILEKSGEGSYGINPDEFWGQVTRVVDDTIDLINSEVALIVKTAIALENRSLLEVKLYTSGFTAVFIIVLLIVARSADRFARPIIAGVSLLTEVAKNGNLNVKMSDDHLQRQDEIGDLARSIQDLVSFQRKEMSVAAKLASGDWDQDIVIRSQQDELGLALKTMIEKVETVLANVKISVDEVGTGADQISDASQSLSQGATETAASLEEISASLVEIGQKARQNAETANQANLLAVNAKEAAQGGSVAMESLKTAIDSITQSSGQIAKIIKTIDEIAFQTNILALNAAVEAARAGRHGKGFAVVAEEVRALAAKSAKAASETAVLIEGSQKNVEEGNKVAGETVVSFSGIVDNVMKVGAMVSEMMEASNDQAQAITEISLGLSQIDAVTQQNTAVSEETAAAAADLSMRSGDLLKMVAQFKLRERK